MLPASLTAPLPAALAAIALAFALAPSNNPLIPANAGTQANADRQSERFRPQLAP